MVRYSAKFAEILENYELLESKYKKIENEVIILKQQCNKTPLAKITVDSNGNILVDEKGGFIIDTSAGELLYLRDYYLRKEIELRTIVETFDYIKKEFEKVKKIYISDAEKYEKEKQKDILKQLNDLTSYGR